jgi:hypothetical protein
MVVSILALQIPPGEINQEDISMQPSKKHPLTLSSRAAGTPVVDEIEKSSFSI